MDEMKIKTSFMKALVSTAISKLIRSKGMEIDISISEFELTHDNNDKLKLAIKAEGSCTEDQLLKLVNG